jgi:hypothetical protein
LIDLTGLIYRNFQSLAMKFDIHILWNPPNPIVPVDTNRVPWNEVLDQLQFNILPRLQQQINTLPKLLNLSELQEDMNGFKIQLITEVQSELDQSTDQLLSFSAGIQHKADSSPTQADDKDLRELKQFRRRGLSSQLQLVKDPLRLIFNSCSSITRELKDTTSHSHQNPKSRHTCGITQSLAYATRLIKQVMKWRISHEFILIRDYWRAEVSTYDDEIAELTDLINRAMNLPEPQDDNGKSSHALRRTLNKHAIPLAQSLIPFIKLCRFFFRTSVRNALDTIPSKSFTDMNSHQLTRLRGSAGLIEADFFVMMNSIAPYDEYPEEFATDPPESIDDTIHKIIDRLDSNLALVIRYVIPLLTNSISSPNHLKSSLLMWKNLFLTAAQNCIRAAHSYNAAAQSSDAASESSDAASQSSDTASQSSETHE